MPVFAVVYRYTDEHARREEVRPTHREFLTALGETLLCAGPFGPDEEAGALLLLQASTTEDVVDLTTKDPFGVHNLVADVEVRRHWMPALGPLAAHMSTP